MTVRYVKPAATGTGDGSSWANAAPTTSVQALHDASTSGDTIWMQAWVTHTAPASPWNWTKKVNVEGRDTSGVAGYAILEGTRSNPWPVNGVWTDSGAYTAGTIGGNVFHYKDAAAATGGCTFTYLSFRNVGSPFRPLFTSSAVLGLITLDHCRCFNTNGLVYIESSGDGQCSITASNCKGRGYSQGMFRAFGDIRLTDCFGDAQGRYHAPSTNLYGFHCQDAIAGVTTVKYNMQLVRCGFVNHNAGAPAGSSKDPATSGTYPQGDGGVGEENTQLLPSSDLYFANNSDRGLDMKFGCAEGDLTRMFVVGNSYNIGVHDDLALTIVTDSYIGPSYMPSYRTAAGNKAALIQGSGHLRVIRCTLEQNVPAGQSASQYFVCQATTQPSHLQSGVTIPNRVGAFEVNDSIRHQLGGTGREVIASAAFGTPTYTETNVTTA